MALTQIDYLINGIVFSAGGFLFLAGLVRKWKWVLNPQHPIAKYMGINMMKAFVFILGGAFFVFGLASLYWAFF